MQTCNSNGQFRRRSTPQFSGNHPNYTSSQDDDNTSPHTETSVTLDSDFLDYPIDTITTTNSTPYPATTPVSSTPPSTVPTPPMAAAATTRTEHCTFNLDGDLEGENPRQWLKGLEEEFRDTDTEADKVMLWQRRMLADSEAEDWFDNLDAVTTSTHANLKTAFALQWLAAPRIKDSRERKLEKVRECILKEEDMFAKVDDANGKKVWGQVKWVTEIAKLAADAGDVGGVMINLVLLLLLKVIQEALESDYATWAELSTAVLKLSKQKITLQAEKDRMMTEVLAKLERLSLTPAMKQQQHSPIIVPPP